MRAIVLNEIGGPENLAVTQIPDPEPGPGEVVIEVHAAAVNFADLLVIKGDYQVRPDLPFTPGKEAAGVVTAVGEGVTGLAPGNRVMAQVDHGAYADRMVASEAACFNVPDKMGFDEAAAIGIAYQTAHFALVERAQIQPGETAFVTGASGSVGLAALQLAKVFGCTVLAGLTSMEKSDLARESGAHHVIDLSCENPRDSIREQVLAVTEGKGADVIIEIVGGEVFAGAIRAVAWRGRLVVVGFTSGTIPELKTNYLLLKNIAVTGVNWSDFCDREPGWVRRVQDDIFALYLEGKLRVAVQAAFPLEDVVKAFDVIRNREIRGKVVLTMGREGDTPPD